MAKDRFHEQDSIANAIVAKLVFPRGQKQTAEILAAGQSQAWNSLMRGISDGLRINGAENNRLSDYCDELRGDFSRLAQGTLTIEKPDGSFEVSGKLPILLAGHSQLEEMGFRHPGAVLARIADVEPIGIVQRTIGDDRNRANLFSAAFVIPHSIDIGLRKHTVQMANDLREEIVQNINKPAAKFLAEIAQHLENIRAKVEVAQEDASKLAESAAAARTDANDLREFVVNLKSKIDYEVREIKAAGRTALSEFKATAHEAITLDGATRIWKNKARWHMAKGFFGASVLIALLISFGVFFTTIIEKAPAFVNNLPRTKDGNDVSYAALILITAALIWLGWIFRIFTRWFTNELTLYDDARQRRALADTYLNLVADKKAKMQVGDRILIISALFRPLPGHQPEEVAPPTVADFVNNLMKPSK